MDLGIRVSIFMQGCAFNCKECFNPETHDFKGGKELTYKIMQDIIQLCNKSYIAGLSILGGEPLHPLNVDGTMELVNLFKNKYPNKTVWVWTGFRYETLIDWVDLSGIDILVDGQFEIEKKDIKLKYCGSDNQRVIDIHKSWEEGKVVEYIDR
ncbi:anaerobic ribonucleoside-triphosphate reductase activating protein [uncultured Clostridium sp.]|uniref:anaerobic ribonucleoside-triphosphate reductase activating protein n=1 Tax=uncultured Clostridium sp. TaxID=59620 RepID=UPI0026EF13C4|nr:anaerobic ribonucleoside-triphosphate reductase activating protein [uncultured Clostridium sp.]